MLTMVTYIWIFATVAFLLATATGWVDDPRDIIFSLIILALLLVVLLIAGKDAKDSSPASVDTKAQDPE